MPLVLSLTLAAGLVLVFLAVTAREGGERQERRPQSRRLPSLLDRLSVDGVRPRDFVAASLTAGLVAGVAAQVTLGWPVVTLAAFAVGIALPGWYYRQRRERRRADVEEAVAEAVDALRDAVRIGLGIEEALNALGRNGPEALRPVFRDIERDSRLESFESALRSAQGRVADPVFDSFAVAMLMAYRIGGRNLAAVFDGLSRSIRSTVQARREVRAAQATNVLSARVVAALPLVLIVVIRATNPGYLAVFSSPGGQGVLALCLLSVAAGYAAMLRAAALPEERGALR